MSRKSKPSGPTGKAKGPTGSTHNRTAKGGIPQKDSLVRFLESTTLEQVLFTLPKRKIRTLCPENSISEAVEVLSRFQILSAPVVSGFQNQTFHGFVDITDILYFIVKVHLGADDHDVERKLRNYDDFEAINEQLKTARLSQLVSDLAEDGQNSPVVLHTSSLFECIGLFQKGLHRVAVGAETDGGHFRICNVLTQSDVIRFLVMKLDEHDNAFDKSLQELDLGGPLPHTVLQSETTIRVMMFMKKNNIRAVGVVDREGKLVANLSASDLKGAVNTTCDSGTNGYSALLMSCWDWLIQSGMSCIPPVTCSKESPLYFVLLSLLGLRVHRIWVVDSERRPTGVVTLTDIMEALISEKQPERRQ